MQEKRENKKDGENSDIYNVEKTKEKGGIGMQAMLKYSGGKRNEIKYFKKYIPKEFDKYIEPFIGGGAVYFHLEPEKAIINDINTPLIEFYKGIRDNYEKIYEELKELNEEYRDEEKREELYYKIRDMYNGKIEVKYEPAAIYYFINKTAYSGMIRYNQKGEFNVPFGRYKNINIDAISEEHHKLLKKTKIYNENFEKIIKMAKKDDFVFLDPPYDTTFKEYGNLKNDFGENEHRKLAKIFKESKAKIMLVISETPLILELYGDYVVDTYEKRYAVNIKNRFKSKAKHLIIKNYE